MKAQLDRFWGFINHDYKYIYVHIPGTLSSPMIEYLWGQPLKVKLLDHKTTSYKDISHYKSVIFLRNPWARLVDIYSAFNSQNVVNPVDDPMYSSSSMYSALLKAISFKQMIHYLVDGRLTNYRSKPDLFKPQNEYVLGDAATAFDYIGRYESFINDANAIHQMLHIDNTTAQSTIIPPDHTFTQQYDSELQQLVGKFYDIDIQKFHYTFK